MTFLSLFALSRKMTKRKGNENYDYDGINRTPSDKIIFNFTWRQFTSQMLADSLGIGAKSKMWLITRALCKLWLVCTDEIKMTVMIVAGMFDLELAERWVFPNNDRNSAIKLCALRNHQAWWDLWVQLLVLRNSYELLLFSGNEADIGAA